MDEKLVNGFNIIDRRQESCAVPLHGGWLARLNCIIQNCSNRTRGE